MECLNASDWIAIFALIVSIAAAYFAKGARDAAKKSNDINLHTHQKKIRDAFIQLKMHITIKGKYIQLDEVNKFYYSKSDAHLYFNQETSEKIRQFFDLCFDVADLARTNRNNAELSEAANKIQSAQSLANELETEIERQITLI